MRVAAEHSEKLLPTLAKRAATQAAKYTKGKAKLNTQLATLRVAQAKYTKGPLCKWHRLPNPLAVWAAVTSPLAKPHLRAKAALLLPNPLAEHAERCAAHQAGHLATTELNIQS